MILVIIILWEYTHGAIMATYLLHGLGAGVTSVSSSEGWAGQPTLDFPGIAFLYFLGANYPDKGANGVDIEKGE